MPYSTHAIRKVTKNDSGQPAMTNRGTPTRTTTTVRRTDMADSWQGMTRAMAWDHFSGFAIASSRVRSQVAGFSGHDEPFFSLSVNGRLPPAAWPCKQPG